MAPGRSLTAALKKTNLLSTEGYMCDMSMLASSGLGKKGGGGGFFLIRSHL